MAWPDLDLDFSDKTVTLLPGQPREVQVHFRDRKRTFPRTTPPRLGSDQARADS
jgi:hypothetical protein